MSYNCIITYLNSYKLIMILIIIITITMITITIMMIIVVKSITII